MERCNYAYRKPGKNAVFCKYMPKNGMDYCIKQVMCRETARWEAASCMVDNCGWFHPEEMLEGVDLAVVEEPAEANAEETVEEPAPKRKKVRAVQE